MTHPLRSKAVAWLSAMLFLGGCACDSPCTNEDLVVAGPTYTAAFYPNCNGRSVRVTAHLTPHGSRVEALRVLVTNNDGAIQSEAPTVRVLSGARVDSQTTDGGATVLWFASPGPCDGQCVTMQVTVPCSGRCPYRIRLVPVLKA